MLMPGNIFFYTLLLSFAFNRSVAQAFDSSLVIPHSSLRNTSFTAFFLVDSFSKAGDSVQASAYLMRLDPYYLIFQALTPSNVDTFFSEYKVTVRAKEAFRKQFVAIYNTPRSEMYETFKDMLWEDQETRTEFDACKDSSNCAVLLRKMMLSDSVHFDYLHKFVKKYGWPKLADGGLFAGFIALHEGADEQLYCLPFMKKAVLQGQANYNMYNNVLSRAIAPNFEKLSRNYKKVHFDISYVLKPQPPSSSEMNVMKEAVKKYKPVKYIYFEFKSKNEKDYKIFRNAGGHAKQGMGYKGEWDTASYWIAYDIMAILESYQRELLSSDYNPFYQFHYEETLSAKNKLIMYLLY
jgi:hypothetical protein